ncbi:NUDIX domain-containing protein [Brevibacillus ruminantium]|uniref:NUDIX domain-containing protein n=1 Tax=Brevibacillus ruminantium TaxID=2950604 RepID=A0ABY4WJU3_9BACL|nr:NUDIX domain-containing protein [Brevibacillus ruminantium]USG67423.1 NUDIX domain-containing protein [Brevibacillus ruminantium]
MGMSLYYQELREKYGSGLLFMPAVAGIIRNESGQILLGRKHREELWGLIAGAIEIGETPAQAVCREVWEETGLQVEPKKIIGVFGGKGHRFTYQNGHQVEYLTIVFACGILGGELHPMNEEMGELRYFDESALPPMAIAYPKEIFLQLYADHVIFE